MSAEQTLHDEPMPPSSQRPTIKPPARSSGLRLKASDADLPIQELLARFELGDYLGALAVADTLLDDRRKPELLLSADDLKEVSLDHRAGFLLSLIDGTASLEAVLDASGMPMIDALRIFCELVEKKIVALR